MKHPFTAPGIRDLIAPMIGQVCCRKQVGFRKSLSLGFGEKIFHNKPTLRDPFYGQWELGTYNSAWRVIAGGHILCGSHDPVESIEELDAMLQEIEFGRLALVQMHGDLDVRVGFEGGLVVDFLASTSEDDECFHVFCPHGRYVEMSVRQGWISGESGKPWPNTLPTQQ